MPVDKNLVEFPGMMSCRICIALALSGGVVRTFEVSRIR